MQDSLMTAASCGDLDELQKAISASLASSEDVLISREYVLIHSPHTVTDIIVCHRPAGLVAQGDNEEGQDQ